jgi:hypothetical protein
LGCHERDDTTLKSLGKAKFTSATKYLVSKHNGQEVFLVFISNTSLPLLNRFRFTIFVIG